MSKCFAIIVLFAMIKCNLGAQKLCGRQLSDALGSLCVNGYNPNPVKRALAPEDYYNDVEDELQFPYDQAPFIAKIRANMLTKSRRRRHGVYDECCKKPCTYSELLSYCL